jgi:hypothetical protein
MIAKSVGCKNLSPTFLINPDPGLASSSCPSSSPTDYILPPSSSFLLQARLYLSQHLPKETVASHYSDNQITFKYPSILQRISLHWDQFTKHSHSLCLIEPGHLRLRRHLLLRNIFWFDLQKDLPGRHCRTTTAITLPCSSPRSILLLTLSNTFNCLSDFDNS